MLDFETLSKHQGKLESLKRPNGNYIAIADESHFPGTVTLDAATTDNREHLIPVVQAKRRDWT